MYGYIYKTTNLINHKIYIGQHKSKTFNPNYKGSGVLMLRAIKEYGKLNFKVELLEECETREELNEKELYYIELYNSRDLDIGYNISIGGHERFFTGQKHSEASRLKMSIQAKNRPHPPTTLNRITVNNGSVNKMINVDELDSYINQGWSKGRYKTDRIAWNKGLTKENDERIARYSDHRKQLFKERKVIGCFGIKGNTNGFVKGHTSWNKGAHVSTHELSLRRNNNK